MSDRVSSACPESSPAHPPRLVDAAVAEPEVLPAVEQPERARTTDHARRPSSTSASISTNACGSSLRVGAKVREQDRFLSQLTSGQSRERLRATTSSSTWSWTILRRLFAVRPRLLDQAHPRLDTVTGEPLSPSQTRSLGLAVLRGTSLVVLSPVDGYNPT